MNKKCSDERKCAAMKGCFAVMIIGWGVEGEKMDVFSVEGWKWSSELLLDEKEKLRKK